MVWILELVKRLDWFHVEKLAEPVVARHAALAVAHDVDGRKVQVLAIGTLEVAKKVGKVVDRYPARIAHTKRIEDVSHPPPGAITVHNFPNFLRNFKRPDGE